MSRYNWNSDWDEGLEEVARLDSSAGYNWDEFVVWYSPEESRYYWFSDSGCSCNSFADSITSRDELERGSYAEAMAALAGQAARMRDDEYIRLSPAEGVRQIEKLANFRPEEAA